MPLPQLPAVRKIDSISQVPYRIGYSFRNPTMLKPLTHTRERPYFAMDWAIKGPTQVKEELWQQGKIQELPATWRRSAKAMTNAKLGRKTGLRKELPNFNELGEAPGATDATTTSSTVSRSGWGFLDNLIKTAGGLVTQQQQLSIAKAQAMSPQYPGYMPGQYPMYAGADGGIGTVGWLAIASGLGIAAFVYMRNR